MGFIPNKHHLREVLLHYFIAAETYHLLVDIYGEHAPLNTTCKEWFRRFKNDDFDIEDKEHGKPPKKFEDAELEESLAEDCCQTQSELAATLNVDRSTFAKRLRAIGMVQKASNWVPHELKDRDIERRKTICEMLLQRQERKGFLHRIITGDEKWIYYENPKRKKAWVKSGEAGPLQPKKNIHYAKVMLCIWWDQKGVVHYELLKPSDTITGDVYRRQLMRLKVAIEEKRPEWVNRHSKLIFQHDNARPHTAKVVKTYLNGQDWKVLPHPLYSPDIAPSDYYLFRTMQSDLTGERFTSYESIKIWLDNWIASKDQDFFMQGIRKLPERWAKVVAADGAYFE